MRKYIDDILATAGGICISIGCFFIGIVQGFIITGILLILAAWIWSKGGDKV